MPKNNSSSPLKLTYMRCRLARNLNKPGSPKNVLNTGASSKTASLKAKKVKTQTWSDARNGCNTWATKVVTSNPCFPLRPIVKVNLRRSSLLLKTQLNPELHSKTSQTGHYQRTLSSQALYSESRLALIRPRASSVALVADKLVDPFQ